MLQKIYRYHYFDNSIRTFYPLAALLAVIVPLITVLQATQLIRIPFELFNVYQWHGYQMLFGYTFTIVLGFILTAGGHWTGVGPLGNKSLSIMFLLWCIDLIMVSLTSSPLLILFASSTLSFYFLFHLNNLLKKYKMRIRFMLLIGSIPVLKTLYLAGIVKVLPIKLQFITDITLIIYIIIVTTIAGRVTPRFTKNYFKFKYSIEAPTILNNATIISTAFLLLTLYPKAPSSLSFAVTFLCGFLHFLRFSFWRPFHAVKEPTMGFLHIGHFLFSCSILFKSLTHIYPSLDAHNSSTHFLLIGGLSFTAMNIMVRATLGHTGRKIYYTRYIQSIFLFIFAGMLIRVFVPIIEPIYFDESLYISTFFWILGFSLYLYKFIPLVIRKRLN